MINKNICIIGGAGFIGKHIVNLLGEHNNIVIIDIVDKLDKDFKVQFPFYTQYINYYSEGYKIFKRKSFDYIFFLAGNVSISESIKNPSFDLQSNTLLLLELLETIKHKSSKIIFSSSAACYGEMNKINIREKIIPLSPYGISKLASEHYLKYYHKKYYIPVLICRFFSLFGEYQYKQVVFDTAVRLLKNQKEINVYNPYSKRDFIYIKDALKAVLFLCEKNKFNSAIYDIGSGKITTILNLTKKIAGILGLQPILHKTTEKGMGNPKMQIANIKPLTDLGFSFDTKFEDNLTNTINWIKKIYD